MKKVEYGYDFDRAIVGTFGVDHIVYSYDKMLEIVMEDIEDNEEARVFLDDCLAWANPIMCDEDFTEYDYEHDERPIIIDDFDQEWFELCSKANKK